MLKTKLRVGPYIFLIKARNHLLVKRIIKLETKLLKFDKQGDKTGWTYIEVSASIASQLKPGNKKIFQVKGQIDNHKIAGVSLLPMGEGDFIMPVNAAMRKAIGKIQGAKVVVQLEEDKKEYEFNEDFIACLQDDPAAFSFFNSLPGSHQRYFSKWIDSAKTVQTKTKRIAMSVSALAKKWGYPEMIRASKAK